MLEEPASSPSLKFLVIPCCKFRRCYPFGHPPSLLFQSSSSSSLLPLFHLLFFPNLDRSGSCFRCTALCIFYFLRFCFFLFKALLNLPYCLIFFIPSSPIPTLRPSFLFFFFFFFLIWLGDCLWSLIVDCVTSKCVLFNESLI